MSKKVVSIKVEKISEKELSELNEQDMKIERLKDKLLLADKDTLIYKLNKALHERDMKIIDMSLSNVKKQIDDHKVSMKMLREEKSTLSDKVKKRYNLEDGWGYHPETGKIIEGGN